MLPPSVAIFSAMLKNDGHEIELFDTTYWEIQDDDLVDNESYKEKNLHVRPYEKSKQEVSLKKTDVYAEFSATVDDFEPDLIAVSCTEDLFLFAIRLLKAIKNKRKAKTIIGGMLPTFAPEKVIRYPEIDIVCVGEGEQPLLELCRRIENGQNCTDVPSLWFKQNGTVHKNPLCPPFNLDDVPLLDLDIFEEARFYKPFDGKVYKTFPVETHRGCSYCCTYCNSPDQRRLYQQQFKNGFFRIKSIDNVRAEMLHFKNGYSAEYLYFWADTFLASPQSYLQEFAEMYADEIALPFWIQTRPETINENNLRLLKKMGIHRMGLGLEHGNEEFRRKVLKRNMSNKDTIRKLRMIADYDIKFSVNNIIGFPMETRQLALDTIRLNRQIPADTYNMYTFTPFHGTALRTLAVEKGILDPEVIATSLANATVLDMPQFTRDQIEGLKRCFIPYVLLDESRWPQIQQAEMLTPQGNAIWEKLIEECGEKFF
ncbi:MAG: B12-binding domain-containing radical SAM protein [Planctomycetes bacterium]|nr:B12-binding domain-containing radical SAM protein [Planctomycetota bacterium]